MNGLLKNLKEKTSWQNDTHTRQEKKTGQSLKEEEDKEEKKTGQYHQMLVEVDSWAFLLVKNGKKEPIH